MKTERLDPRDLDLATAEEMAEVSRADLAVDMPNAIPMTGEGLLLQARYGHDDVPFERLWLARSDDGQLLGHASLDIARWDNARLAMVFTSILPSAGDDVDTQFLAAQLAAARELERPSLLTFAPVDGRQAQFLAANGFAIGQHTAQRRLRPQELDFTRIAQLEAAASEASSDYELRRLDGPAPEEMLPELTAMHDAINDAPVDDIDYEKEEFPVERVRRLGNAMVARRQHVYRIMARQRRTGDWAGHTILCVDETRPGYAVQEDTSVRRAHRGHRLGMRLKASMLLWMHEEHPELTAIDTWNSTTNAHMIAVNEALGCQVSALGVAMQRTL